MKKIVFSVIAFAAIMVSCSSNEDLASASLSTTASTAVTAYVAENYPDTKVVSTTVSGSTVTATLSTGEELTFTTSGSVISYVNNYSAGLKADSLVVSDSVTTDSVGKHHHRGGHGGKGGGSKSDSISAGKHGHDRHFENEVSVDSLSTSINDYILTNYSGYSVIHAQVDTICSGVVTSVMVCKTDAEPIKLVFDASAAFVMSGVRALSASFPAEVLSAITTNYSTYTLRTRGSIYTLANGTIEYKVYLKLDKVQKAIYFNADGTVACEL